MRRHKLNWIWIILLGLFVGSCEDYLDRSPDDGLSEDDVYKDYSSLLGFMDRIFQNDDILIFTHGINSYSNTYVTVGNLSDEYASVRDNDPSKFVNAGNWLENASTRFEIGSKSDGKNNKSAISPLVVCDGFHLIYSANYTVHDAKPGIGTRNSTFKIRSITFTSYFETCTGILQPVTCIDKLRRIIIADGCIFI